MKKINWTRVALYVVGVVIVFRVFSSIYMSGFFHPKAVSVNGIKLTAPKGSYLIGISSSNNKYYFDALSPLKLNFGSKYFIDNNQSIRIIFADIGKGDGIKDISLTRTSRIAFNRTLLEWGNMQDFTVSLFKNGYGECSDIYRVIKTPKEDTFFHLLLYNEEKKMEFSFIITDEVDVKISLDEICNKKHGNKID
jgi:hypothetical protein